MTLCFQIVHYRERACSRNKYVWYGGTSMPGAEAGVDSLQGGLQKAISVLVQL